MLAALLALQVLLARGPGACWMACDLHSGGVEAAMRLRHDLGGPLPEGTEVVGLREGGFQDRFIQARLSIEHDALPALLAALHVEVAALAPLDQPYLGGPAPAWFDWESRDGLILAEGWTGTLDHVTVAVAPDLGAPGRDVVYLWGFQT